MSRQYQANLNPQTFGQRAMQPGVRIYRDQVYYTTPAFIEGGQTARLIRRRTVKFSGMTIGQQLTDVFRVDQSSVVYLQTGSARDAGDTALPVNMHPLDTFRVSFDWGTGDKIDSESVLARNVLGTAERPCHIGGGGLRLEAASSVSVTVTALRANMEYDITFFLIESRNGNSVVPFQ